jgi:hypothetical protein
MFLRLVVIHKSMFQGGKTCSWDQARLVISICALLQNEHVQRDEPVFEYAFDVATYLIDGKIVFRIVLVNVSLTRPQSLAKKPEPNAPSSWRIKHTNQVSGIYSDTRRALGIGCT